MQRLFITELRTPHCPLCFQFSFKEMLPEGEQDMTPSFCLPSPLLFFLLFPSKIGTVYLLDVRYGPKPQGFKEE